MIHRLTKIFGRTTLGTTFSKNRSLTVVEKGTYQSAWGRIGLWGRKRRTTKAAVPPMKKMVMRMKQRRSMTAAATIQSFIIRWVSSVSWRSRAMVDTAVSSKSRMLTSSSSIPAATCPTDSASDDESFVRRLLPSFSVGELRESTFISSTFAFPLPPLGEQAHFTHSSVARYWHTSFLNCSYDKHTKQAQCYLSCES